VAQNRTTIQHEIGEDWTELYLDAFDSIQEEDCFEIEYNVETGETSLLANNFQVVHVGDENSSTELVYGICVHGARKQMTVAFRGCTSKKDWQVSADYSLSLHPNPVSAGVGVDDEAEAYNAYNPTNISIHHGFYNYLFPPSKNNEGMIKYEEITSKLRQLLQQHPGYRVYVTGHSLGGALATVFAFYAASSEVFGTVTCITVGSPMVGNLSFEQAFKSLERRACIRCLRITNHFDIFTQLPDRGAMLYAVFFWSFHLVPLLGASCLFFLCFQNNVYRHVGMDLHLYRLRGYYKIKHARGSAESCCRRVWQDWRKYWKQTFQRLLTVPFSCFGDFCYCKHNFKRNHGIPEHRARLKELSTELGTVYLNDLYDEMRI
jgi:pimeloyl-ACP methyl ester carboxylesterase